MDLRRPTGLRAPAASQLKSVSGYQVSMAPGSSDVIIRYNGAEVMRISLGAIMSIKSQNDLLFEAPNITLKAANSVKIEAGSIAFKSGTMLMLESGTTMNMKSAATMALKAGSSMGLDGSKVSINGSALEIT